MKILSLLVLLTAALAVSVFAQDDPYTAPIVWEKYRIADQKLSISFPKLPTVVTNSGGCSRVESHSYYAYTDGIVYETTVVARNKQWRPEACHNQEEPFGPDLVKGRLNELRSIGGVDTQPVIEEVSGRKVYKFEKALGSRWFYDDSANDRWIEMTLHCGKDEKGSYDHFLDSVQFSSSEGKVIGEGATRTLGDLEATQPVAPKREPEKPSAGAGLASSNGSGSGMGNGSDSPTKIVAITSPLTIIGKPRALYTDEARKAMAQGTVSVKVTLLANGGVGSVVVVTPLEYGLTEQAIAAAKRLVFLPKRINGYPVSVTKMIEYNFNIY
jgi:TonB family C-terminal domain